MTNLLRHYLSEAPTAASTEFLEALSDAAFPRKRRAGLPGWPGNWKQGGLCPLCPADICFPWGAISISHSGSQAEGCFSPNRERHTSTRTQGASGQLAGAINYPSGLQGQSSALPPQRLGELLPRVRGNNVFIH